MSSRRATEPVPARDRGHAADRLHRRRGRRSHRRVVLRKMTGREEAHPRRPPYQRNGGKLVTGLLHSCIVELGDCERTARAGRRAMYSADRNYLLLRLRSFTFGPSSRRRTPAPPAVSSFDVIENLDELPVRMLPRARSSPRTSWSSWRTATSTRTAGAHRADAAPAHGRGRGGGGAADAQERLAGQERAARALLGASAMCPRTGSRRSARRSCATSRSPTGG